MAAGAGTADAHEPALQVPATAAVLQAAAPTPAETARRSLWRDPQDGHLDASGWLLEKKGGFLPVPIIITDPAVGNGGGLALAFFRPHRSSTHAEDTARGRRPQTPDIYGAMAMRTSNGTEALGAGAMLHFDEDRWRYRGGLGKASINLDFHAPGNRVSPPLKISYNADGIASFQQVFRRIGSHELFIGLAWIYMDVDLSFDSDRERDRFSDKERASRSSGLGLALEYDSRDNAFTPSRGWLGSLEANAYDALIGSDNDFQSYRGHAYGYLPIGERLVLGGRADVRWAEGDVPFYRLPYIDMRGIGSARYQDHRAATLETELRWNLSRRWALVGFVGAGRTWGRHNDVSDGPSQVARGAGVRYLLVRQLGLYAGIDYAWGPEDDTFYIQVGSAWR